MPVLPQTPPNRQCEQLELRRARVLQGATNLSFVASTTQRGKKSGRRVGPEPRPPPSRLKPAVPETAGQNGCRACRPGEKLLTSYHHACRPWSRALREWRSDLRPGRRDAIRSTSQKRRRGVECFAHRPAFARGGPMAWKRARVILHFRAKADPPRILPYTSAINRVPVQRHRLSEKVDLTTEWKTLI